jgi:hypothetical protein
MVHAPLKRDPPMTEETLRELLARVHERLSSSSTIDQEEREMLAMVMRDIDSALGRGSAGTPEREGTGAQATSAAAGSPPVAVVAKPGTPPLEILEAVAVRFEAEHPAIAQLLRQIAALLGQAGI